MIAAALLPMPPETDSGAGVLLLEPIKTPELKSEERIVFPEPAGVNVRFPLPPVAMVNAPVSLKLLADKVWVAPLIDRPLMVLVGFAAIIPPRLRLPARESVPVLVRKLAFEKKLMLPVSVSPNCRVCPFVVASIPVAVR